MRGSYFAGCLAALLLLFACTPPPSGTLFVAISGLPDGTAARVRVEGPSAFAADPTASREFAALPPGSYTVSAEAVTVPGDASYQATVSGSPAEVVVGETSLVTVVYSAAAAAIPGRMPAAAVTSAR